LTTKKKSLGVKKKKKKKSLGVIIKAQLGPGNRKMAADN
jgi:hypothetical protein